jgi:hypothetical protein
MGPGDDLDVTRLGFENPPVRAVFLTLQFKTDDHIQASHVAPLRTRWKEDFPLVVETAPLPPLGDSDEGPRFLRSSETWPLPFTRCINVEGDKFLAFQDDRFQVGWRFDPEADNAYPGFEELAQSLAERFAEFQAALEEVGNVVTLTGSDCRYVNALEGLSMAEAATGVLTDWTAAPSTQVADSPFVGVHLHACTGEGGDRHCSAVVTIDSDANDVTTMTIRVWRVAEDGMTAELGGLYEAHEEVDEIFVRFTSDQQHRDWGRIA